jgi:hypothetical protein
MTTKQAHAITAICTALIIGAILCIAYLSFYNPPQPPPIDPRKAELLQSAQDSLNAVKGLKSTHIETVKQAEEMPKVKRVTKAKFEGVKSGRMSQSDSLQGVVLVNRLSE